jgi:hypothetical protein
MVEDNRLYSHSRKWKSPRKARNQAAKERLVVPSYRGETIRDDHDDDVYDGPLDNMATFFQAVQPMEVTMGAAKRNSYSEYAVVN